MPNRFFCSGGGPISLTVNVTCAFGAKPLPRTTNGVLAVPWLWFTVHSTGRTGAALDEPHTVSGASGGGIPGLPELLSAEPRKTPPTTRAAPTAAQPAQAMCAASQPRQPAGLARRARPG